MTTILVLSLLIIKPLANFKLFINHSQTFPLHYHSNHRAFLCQYIPYTYWTVAVTDTSLSNSFCISNVLEIVTSQLANHCFTAYVYQHTDYWLLWQDVLDPLAVAHSKIVSVWHNCLYVPHNIKYEMWYIKI